MNTKTLFNRRILVVEDEYLIAQDVQYDLERAGATVLGPLASVEQALEMIARTDHIDAAVLDVNLGHDTSFPIAHALMIRSIPFLFATGYDASDIPPMWRHARTETKPLRAGAVEELLYDGPHDRVPQ